MSKKIGNFVASPWGQRVTILVIIMVVMAIAEPKFFLPSNFSSILLAISIYGIMACGMLFAVLVGGMDLSMGSMAALTATIMAQMTVNRGTGAGGFFLALVISVACCVAVGVLHGLLVTKGGIPAFVVTLATKYLLYGMVLLITDSSYVYLTERTGLAVLIGNARPLGIPMPIIIFAVVIIATVFVLNFTVYGRRLYAVGGNMVAADYVGIKSKRNVIVAFVVSSLAAGIGGMVLGSMNMVAGSGTAGGYEGDVLMAMIVGGINLAGGEGGVMGAVYGALLVGIINNVMILLNIPCDYQDFVKGVVIIAALALNIYTARRSQGLTGKPKFKWHKAESDAKTAAE